jgi:hypothetical protein
MKAPKESKAGRKPATIDWKLVDNLLKAGCAGTEIAAHIGVHPDTLYNHCKADHKTDFSAYSQEKKAAGDAILKVTQYQVAINDKDKTMLVWLGKQRLGQTDKREIDQTNREAEPESLEEIEKRLADLRAKTGGN